MQFREKTDTPKRNQSNFSLPFFTHACFVFDNEVVNILSFECHYIFTQIF